MKFRKTLIIATIALLATGAARAQDAVSDVEDPNQVLKIAALEALISAPPERALPLAIKVLDAENTSEVKEAALFVLSQIEMPEARNKLLDVARRRETQLDEVDNEIANKHRALDDLRANGARQDKELGVLVDRMRDACGELPELVKLFEQLDEVRQLLET